VLLCCGEQINSIVRNRLPAPDCYLIGPVFVTIALQGALLWKCMVNVYGNFIKGFQGKQQI
jgi:hypothetical protein